MSILRIVPAAASKESTPSPSAKLSIVFSGGSSSVVDTISSPNNGICGE